MKVYGNTGWSGVAEPAPVVETANGKVQGFNRNGKTDGKRKL